MYLGFEIKYKTVFCRMLQRMARMCMDWNLKNYAPTFLSLNARLAKIIKTHCLVLSDEICLGSSSHLWQSILCMGVNYGEHNTVDSLLTDTSIRRTPRVCPCLCLFPLFDSP